jgi:hypothetical protein
VTILWQFVIDTVACCCELCRCIQLSLTVEFFLAASSVGGRDKQKTPFRLCLHCLVKLANIQSDVV